MVVSPKIGRLAIYGVDLTDMLFFGHSSQKLMLDI